MAKISDFTPDKNNANKGTQRGLSMLTDSLQKRGAGRSILVDKNGVVIAGNKTLQCAADIGLDDVVIVQTDGSKLVAVQRTDLDLETDEAARRLAYDDNRVSQIDLDFDPVQIAADMEAGLDLSGLWNPDELSEILEAAGTELLGGGELKDNPELVDKAEELQAKWQCEAGQLWQFESKKSPGRYHKLLIGDCRNPDDVARLLDGQKVNGVFTSPPYAEQRKKQYGGIPTAEYVQWWEAVQANVRANLAGDGSFFVNIKPHCEDGQRVLYVFDLVLNMVRGWGWRYIEEFCWLRNPTPKQVVEHFKQGFESVYQFSIDRFKFNPDDVRHHSKNVPIPGGKGTGNTNWAGRQGRIDALANAKGAIPGMAYPSTVLDFAKTGGLVENHSAAFPVALPAFFIKAYSDPLDSWYDPFCGSGTVIVACENEGRIGYGTEILPKYGAVICERLKTVGLEPQLIK